MANEPASHAMELIGFSEPPHTPPAKEAKKAAPRKKKPRSTSSRALKSAEPRTE